jgi:hypothetical protein
MDRDCVVIITLVSSLIIVLAQCPRASGAGSSMVQQRCQPWLPRHLFTVVHKTIMPSSVLGLIGIDGRLAASSANKSNGSLSEC